MANFITTMLEYQALYYLQSLFPGRYVSLKYVSGNESPDLQDTENSIGVEVTRIDSDQEMKEFFDRYCGKNFCEVKSRVLEKMRDRAFAFGGIDQKISVLFGPHADEFVPIEVFKQESYEKTLIAAKKKVGILNGDHFQKFRTNELFIFSDNTFSVDYVERTMEEILDYQQNSKHGYSSVYIKGSYNLFLCNLNKRSFQEFDISSIFEEVTERAYRSAQLEING